ncbi:hypothetical protein C8D92_1172 [Tamilnaduibacter salinus]|uniref:Uncharacterized protein n=1 Tax=Tamilnaduibacter salinus TaxID=1484056 RepID=A0A2U1CSY9_9GAMM|nr:hypothetical protein [Tamilnaduibacter salinus]PVY69321.1 hypothetical protein C8D92_1172 [Tamilnaduibacter salinus]
MNTIVLYGGVLGIGGSLICSLIITTVAFPKIKEIEKIISAATLISSSGRNIWGGDPIGRLMRATHIFCFLWMRYIPGHFRRAAGNFGNLNMKIPLHLFLWGFCPTLGLFVFGGLLICASFFIA